jgi:hypothetical protein
MAGEGTSMHKPLLTVTNVVDPEDPGQNELYEFDVDGQRRTFGRDDSACDIVVWSALNARGLARVAGEIWRWGDELWVRNLATTHEIAIMTPGSPPEQPLRRRRDAAARGAACSVPTPLAVITAPDGCLLEVRQQHQPPAEAFTYGLPEPTVAAVPEVPPQFRQLAAALCEPLLLGRRLPAAYGEVMARLGHASLRTLRGEVESLCRLYTEASPQLAQRVEDRRRRQRDALGAPPVAVRHGAIYGFDPGEPAPVSAARARSLSLPDYFEVAILLVRHYRITEQDLTLLMPREAP